ncbi:E3 ubiquitin-protein ligase MARCHF1-like isoform X2 [Venturia canescens]|uniref:E3 ubiquitin-protein ligase MARCHF1-like isoform X2 n=1 Tax=Venturia canescens TaxID=32260 RepID=UPI001C9C44E7|nr:E3 ubiquitin-protein ligase MARCHF1-like isoform X2 [Venturia canescens]
MSTKGNNEKERLDEKSNSLGNKTEFPESLEKTLDSRDGKNLAASASSKSLSFTGKKKVPATYRKSLEEARSTTTETEDSCTPGDDESDGEVTGSSPVDQKRNRSLTKLEKDGDSRFSSTGDICRICHMGGFPALPGSHPIWEWPNRGPRRIDSQISTLSSYAYLGPLISACKCRGTVGLVHTECLERWLTESGHTRCELCGHRYPTKRVPRHGILRSVIIWFNTVIATRQMLLDVLYLLVTTPLALFSCYVCALALKMIIESGFQEIPWMIVAMLPTCSLTLVAYWGWLITLGRLHGRRWRRFWRNNFVVRLIPESSRYSLEAETSVDDSAQERMEYRLARRMDYDENDFLFDYFPDDENEAYS